MTAAEVAAAAHAFGTAVMDERIKAKLTPRQLAKKANVYLRVVNDVEGGRGCTAVEAGLLAVALGVPLEQLLGTAGAVA